MCCPCCTNTLELGCFDPCGLTVDAGIVGVGDGGVWQIRLTFGRRFILLGQTFAEGDPIIFVFDNVNENYTYTAQITKPDNSIYQYTDPDNVVFDCFKFSTKKGGSNVAVTIA